MGYKLLTLHSAKIDKSNRDTRYLNAVQYLVPGPVCGETGICPHASLGCGRVCLYYAGRGRFTGVRRARGRRTRLFLINPEQYFDLLRAELDRFACYAEKRDRIAAVRLNGTSDIPFYSIRYPTPAGRQTIYQEFGEKIRFYEYTKRPNIDRLRIPQYLHLTFSRSEANIAAARRLLGKGFNIGVVFRRSLPSAYWGRPVVDGDISDLRFLDPVSVPGQIIGFRAKGPATADQSGFVVDIT